MCVVQLSCRAGTISMVEHGCPAHTSMRSSFCPTAHGCLMDFHTFPFILSVLSTFTNVTFLPTSYWTMHFDTSPRTLRSLNSIMRSDPRVIRWTMLKLGEKIEDVVESPEKTTDRSSQSATGAEQAPYLATDIGKMRRTY